MTELKSLRDVAFDAVLFDLDGTLIDSLPGIEYSLRAAIADVAPGAALAPVQSLIGPPVLEMFRRALPGADEPTLRELERAFRRSYDETGYLKTIVYDGVPKLLSLLARFGVKLSIVTNKPPEATRRILEHLGFRPMFGRVVSTGDWLPVKKTKSEATAWLLEQDGLDPARCAFVGDSPDDADAARENRIAFFAAAYGYGRVAAQPGERILPNPGALADFLFLRETLVTVS